MISHLLAAVLYATVPQDPVFVDSFETLCLDFGSETWCRMDPPYPDPLPDFCFWIVADPSNFRQLWCRVSVQPGQM